MKISLKELDKLYKYAKKIKLDFCVTPFDPRFVKQINKYVKFFKVASGDLNFTVGIPGNSLTYLITHNLNKFPAVSVFEDGTQKEIFGEVTYNNLNQCTLTFTSLVTGTATFN